jgi:hypothetical protein
MKVQMRRSVAVVAVLLLVACALAPLVPTHSAPAKPAVKVGRVILAFDTMVGNYPDQTILGVNSDDLPWDINAVVGSLTSTGSIDVQIRGLVFADDPEVPPDLRGTNDEPNFYAIITGWTRDDNGDFAPFHITTKPFAASSTGNCHIHDQVSLPGNVVGPIILISGADGDWFASTGVEISD